MNPDPKRSNRSYWFDPDESLLPFKKSLQDPWYWTCNDSRYTTAFGYEYQETRQGIALKEFQNKYSWSFRKDKTNETIGKCPDDMQPLPIVSAQVFQYTQEAKDIFKKLGQGSAGIPAVAQPAPPPVRSSRVAASHPPGIVPAQAEPAKQMQVQASAPVVPSEKAFSNIPSELASKATEIKIDESKVSRSWYIDMLVER